MSSDNEANTKTKDELSDDAETTVKRRVKSKRVKQKKHTEKTAEELTEGLLTAHEKTKTGSASEDEIIKTKKTKREASSSVADKDVLLKKADKLA